MVALRVGGLVSAGGFAKMIGGRFASPAVPRRATGGGAIAGDFFMTAVATEAN